MSSTRRDPLIGDLVDGRYEVLDRVARGGMSTVYRALDHRLDRPVALKVMHPHLAEDPALVRRFEREAKTAARVSHPHVVAVLDQGHTTDPSGDTVAYLVMEHVPGRTLRSVLREEAPTTPRRALELLRPAVEGLAAAHRAGLVHRDVKPENVLVRDDGWVTVADFGLSRAATGHTSAGQAILGTPAYLAPELLSGDGADARADVYAVGIVLFELLTGTQPFTAATPLQVAYRHVHERVPLPSSRAPGLSEALDDLVMWCTEPDPADRPQDAAALLAALDDVRAGLTAAELDHRAAPAAPTAAESIVPAGSSDSTDPTESIAAVDEPRPLPSEDGASTAVLPAARHAAPAGSSHARASEALGAPAVDPAPSPATTPGPATAPSSPPAEASPPGPAAASARARRRQARTPEVRLGAGVGRTVAIGAAVTLLLTGMALLLGWTLGTNGLRMTSGAVMPSVAGLEQGAATARLAEAGLSPDVVTRHDDRFSAGVVVATSPEPGTAVDRGAPVELTVSDGPAPVPVPDLAGLGADDAHAAADAAHLRLAVAERRADAAVPAGAVVDQTPAAASLAPRDGELRVVLSAGPAQRTVPDLVGLPLDQARARLDDLGLVTDVRDGPEDGRAFVARQGTPGGRDLPEGAHVQLWTR